MPRKEKLSAAENFGSVGIAFANARGRHAARRSRASELSMLGPLRVTLTRESEEGDERRESVYTHDDDDDDDDGPTLCLWQPMSLSN